MNLNAQAEDERQIFLDWLRIIALALLILYHIGMIYVPWGFHVKSAQTSKDLIPWMMLTSPWRMCLLFMISGAVTVMMLRRAAPSQLLRRRSKQLFLPLILGIFLIVPPQSYFEVVEKYKYAGNYFEFLKLYFTGYRGFCGAPWTGGLSKCLTLPTWNHLWFLPYLWLYSALLAGAVLFIPAFSSIIKNHSASRKFGLAFLLVPIVYLVLGRLFLHDAYPQTYALAKDWYSHWRFGGAFVWGAWLAMQKDIWSDISRWRYPSLLLAILSWAILVFLRPNKFHEHFVVSVYIASALTAAFGFGYALLNQDHPLRQRLTEAVFPVYIFHQTILIAAHQGLKNFALPLAYEALAVIAITFAFSYALYLLLRPIQWLRPWLGMSAASK